MKHFLQIFEKGRIKEAGWRKTSKIAAWLRFMPFYSGSLACSNSV